MWSRPKKIPNEDARKLLIFLIRKGYGEEAIREVRRLATSGWSLAFYDADTCLTPLLLALDSGSSDPEVAKVLFAHSDDAWQRGRFGFNTLHGAAKSQEFIDIMDFAVRRADNIDEEVGEGINTTALGFATHNLNELGIVKLLRNGASILAGSGAAADGWCSTIWLGELEAKSQRHKYLRDGPKIQECLTLLLEAGLDINRNIEHSFRTSSMIDAVIRTWNLTGNGIARGDEDFQKAKLLLLLQNGANPNIECRESISQKPFRGAPIHACERAEQLATLLDHGADPHRVATDGRTIIHSIIQMRDHSTRLEDALLRSKFSVSRLEYEFMKSCAALSGGSWSLIESIKTVEFHPFIASRDKQEKIAFLGRILGNL